MRILAIDPGVDTGFSMTPNGRSADVWQTNFGELSPASPHLALHATLVKVLPDVIVCERFDFRQNKRGVDYTPVEYIGVIQLYCQSTDTPLHFQGQDITSEKSFWNRKKLKFLGLYQEDFVHGMDALKHRLHFEERQGMFDMNQLKGL